MVGIKVGGTYSGLGVGSIGAIEVWFGTGVSVTVAVALGDGIGEGVAVEDWLHAVDSKNNIIKIFALKSFFN
jgi:hypothetical protein